MSIVASTSDDHDEAGIEGEVAILLTGHESAKAGQLSLVGLGADRQDVILGDIEEDLDGHAMVPVEIPPLAQEGAQVASFVVGGFHQAGAVVQEARDAADVEHPADSGGPVLEATKGSAGCHWAVSGKTGLGQTQAATGQASAMLARPGFEVGLREAASLAWVIGLRIEPNEHTPAGEFMAQADVVAGHHEGGADGDLDFPIVSAQDPVAPGLARQDG